MRQVSSRPRPRPRSCLRTPPVLARPVMLEKNWIRAARCLSRRRVCAAPRFSQAAQVARSEGTRTAGSPFFAYFLWRSKESESPAGRDRPAQASTANHSPIKRSLGSHRVTDAKTKVDSLSIGNFLPGQSSAEASMPGNNTSVKPNWLESRIRIGYSLPIRWSHSCCTTRA